MRFRSLAFLLVGVSAAFADGLPDWPTIAVVEVARGLELPTRVTHAGDGSGRLFVTEQPGRVRIIDGTNLVASPFLDITERVQRNPEQGLLGLAFPPSYSAKRYFYVNYT